METKTRRLLKAEELTPEQRETGERYFEITTTTVAAEVVSAVQLQERVASYQKNLDSARQAQQTIVALDQADLDRAIEDLNACIIL